MNSFDKKVLGKQAGLYGYKDFKDWKKKAPFGFGHCLTTVIFARQEKTKEELVFLEEAIKMWHLEKNRELGGMLLNRRSFLLEGGNK